MKNKTEIFPSYASFLNRHDKKINGVSDDFAKINPEFAEQNQNNEGCWNCSNCIGCDRCEDSNDCRHCRSCKNCGVCKDCNNCSDCGGCYACIYCENCCDSCNCLSCNGCCDCHNITHGKKIDTKSWFDVPTIHKIHSKVLESSDKPDALNMTAWHTCKTTHCRAGWVVFLAGDRGKALELASSTLFAAMQIYKASSPEIRVSPVRFFETNEVAMADIRRCAKLEQASEAAPNIPDEPRGK